MKLRIYKHVRAGTTHAKLGGAATMWVVSRTRDMSQVLFLPHDAMLSAVYAVVVCLCVCLSITLQYCIKTAKRKSHK